MKMTHNEFKEYMKQCASRLYNDNNYTVSQYDADCDAVEIIPFDLSAYPQLSEATIKWVNKIFDEEDFDCNGTYILRGFTRSGYTEMRLLNLTFGDYGTSYSFWGYNNEQLYIYTYCEGNTTLALFSDVLDYQEDKENIKNWYKEAYGT